VSSYGQKADLETQLFLLEEFAVENGYTNLVKFRDIASRLNPKRRGLRRIFRLIDANQIDTIIVNYKDRIRTDHQNAIKNLKIVLKISNEKCANARNAQTNPNNL
jgi:predicted site-specific integrase-resolvase